ncbi:hypothetical protein Y032_0048g1713 [Ancylostoma ceylanicum]|uniref:Uncharacterized protein n=1 Tax=Ancylostoma ceylanicum TaxID=53326 RepID=A0A016UAT8_9BILA|nr:hypothetical protein Y032_0048g1713 [Ancylostoma ceylanicum]
MEVTKTPFSGWSKVQFTDRLDRTQGKGITLERASLRRPIMDQHAKFGPNRFTLRDFYSEHTNTHTNKLSLLYIQMRTVFNDASRPTCCYTHPPPKQTSPRGILKYLPHDYVFAMGEIYESSRFQCDLCGNSREGLVRCSVCDEVCDLEHAKFPRTTVSVDGSAVFAHPGSTQHRIAHAGIVAVRAKCRVFLIVAPFS